MTALVETPRNRDLGQVWTPEDIALSMARKALGALPGVRFVLDPACGPGTSTSCPNCSTWFAER